jgi:hypothetical protein
VFFQNSNNSVRVTDDFMEAVQKDRRVLTALVRDGSRSTTVKARDLWRDIAEAAWECGDPGLQYDTTINAWHTSAGTARINASNPCSEYMYLDDSACNLASLNLRKFVGGEASATPGESTSIRSSAPSRSPSWVRRSSSATPSTRPSASATTRTASGRWAWATRTWRAADVARAVVRQPGRACVRGRDHRDHDRLGVPH